MSRGRSRSQCCHIVESNKAEVQIMKAYRVAGGIVPLILNLATQCRWVTNIMPCQLSASGKEPPVYNEQDAVWALEPVALSQHWPFYPSSHIMEERNLSVPANVFK